MFHAIPHPPKLSRHDRSRYFFAGALCTFILLAYFMQCDECPPLPELVVCPPLPPVCLECPPPLPAAQNRLADYTRAQMFTLGQRAYAFENPIMDPQARHKYQQHYATLPPEGTVELDDEGMTTLWKQQLVPLLVHFKSPLSGDTWITQLEARVLYSMIRHLTPPRIVEIGSGDSTRVIVSAMNNRTRVQCIEPFRSSAVPKHAQVSVSVSLLQDVNLTLFTSLEAGDLLFIDSSHVTVPYGDVIYEYLFILPLLKPGVYVHVHDVFLPDDYPEPFMAQLKNYTEQWLLALLLRSKEWRVVWATHYMTTRYPELFSGTELSNRDSSFFFVRV